MDGKPDPKSNSNCVTLIKNLNKELGDYSLKPQDTKRSQTIIPKWYSDSDTIEKLLGEASDHCRISKKNLQEISLIFVCALPSNPFDTLQKILPQLDFVKNDDICTYLRKLLSCEITRKRLTKEQCCQLLEPFDLTTYNGTFYEFLTDPIVALCKPTCASETIDTTIESVVQTEGQST